MIYEEIIKDGNELCFDVGANIGNRTKKFIDLGYKNVISIEPQYNCLSILKSRFKNEKKVHIIDMALSDKESVEEIYISNADTISSMDKDFINEVKKDRFKNYNWDKKQKVVTTTLDKLISKYGTPNFIKIDVEGYELNVLKGLSKGINYISFEYTPELHEKSMSCIDILEKTSNYVYNFSIGESLEFYYENWLNRDQIDEKLRKLIGKRDMDNNLLFGDIYAKLK